MFGFITRTEHDRVVAERDDALHLIDKQARDLAQLRAANALLILSNDSFKARLAKIHTTRGPGGRFVKAGTQA